MSDKELHDDARTVLKHALVHQCTKGQRELFCRRFGVDPTRDINSIVDDMTVGQLPWALAQLTNMLTGDDT